MADSKEAIRAIRHGVQEHGDAGTRIGSPAKRTGVVWFGELVGWRWPSSYLEVLEKHDGVMVQDTIIFSFLESFATFQNFHEHWHRPHGYWPVASDGCGNYYALEFASQDADGECPVVYFETIESSDEPRNTVALTYADFVAQHMAAQCRRVSCPGARE